MAAFGGFFSLTRLLASLSGQRKHREDTPMKKENLLEINIQEGSGKREVTTRKSSLRESSNYDANSHATPVNSNG